MCRAGWYLQERDDQDGQTATDRSDQVEESLELINITPLESESVRCLTHAGRV